MRKNNTISTIAAKLQLQYVLNQHRCVHKRNGTVEPPIGRYARGTGPVDSNSGWNER